MPPIPRQMTTAIRYIINKDLKPIPLDKAVHPFLLGRKIPTMKTVECALKDVVSSLQANGLVRCGPIPENVRAELQGIKAESLDFSPLFDTSSNRFCSLLSLQDIYNFFLVIQKNALVVPSSQSSEDTVKSKQIALQNSFSDVAFISVQVVSRPISLCYLPTTISVPIATHITWRQLVIMNCTPSVPRNAQISREPRSYYT